LVIKKKSVTTRGNVNVKLGNSDPVRFQSL